MRTSKLNAMKYVGAAMAVGGSVMLGTAMFGAGTSLKKKAKKTADKAIDAMDSILNSVQDLLK